jgi:hypothetical protein
MMRASAGPTFEPDYVIQFFAYLRAKDVLTNTLCAADLRSKGKLSSFLFRTALAVVEGAIREPPALLAAKPDALKLLEQVLKYLKDGEGDPERLFEQAMKLIDEMDAENRYVVEMMFSKGIRGYVFGPCFFLSR